ncbi:ABC transporter permease [Pseudothioclava nitratireducens]|uniref:ABC transporter permease n=1 Tax=Pseudothioclava nitratireducens TaxID=1928646 RepID=UPI0023DC3C5C|nr:ABC transporter permease [Defluviimonas nitratireducens]MDF1618933.1 ABC transporter permease [Defluviimonas nitratireducens]
MSTDPLSAPTTPGLRLPARPEAPPRTGLGLSMRLEFAESLRSRWFHFYSVVVVGLMLLLITTGISESRVLGFTGLSRLLVTYIQIMMAVLPLFIVVTTARSMVGDREAGNLEYMLAFPVSLRVWYWGRFLARLGLVLAPIALSLALAAGYGMVRGHSVPWTHIALYSGLTAALTACFLGIGFLISALSRSTEVALGASLLVWLALVALLDLLLLSVLIQGQFIPEFVIGIALANPLQSFRTASMILFDPQLILLGPASYVILDHFGVTGYVVWAMIYPTVLGLVFAALGYWRFSRGDLV